MWWIDSRTNRPVRPADRKARNNEDRQDSKRGRSSRSRVAPQIVDSLRCFNLTDRQIAANMELNEEARDQRIENERLVADVRALEQTIRSGRARQIQQQSETLRLRSECDRWLSETQMLSQRLIETAEGYNRLAREYENVRAELETLKSNSRACRPIAKSTPAVIGNTETVSEIVNPDTQNRAA